MAECRRSPPYYWQVPQSVQVSTPVFEGPFDLLLHLITRDQVDLWDVSLSSIVDAYIASLEDLREALDLETATEFLLIAAVLLELKARRLLPGPGDAEAEEELAIWEERDLLLARLLEAKTFKDAAAAISRLMDTAGLSLPRTAGLEDSFVDLLPDLLAGVTPERLRDAMQEAAKPRPTNRVLLDHVAPIRISVTDAVEELLGELPRAGTITFAALTAGVPDRLRVIVRFLAILELFKQGMVELAQVGNFADLHVQWVGSGALDLEVEEYEGS
jgi:segregation and condensation protein A